jgi:hypothetical protein
LARTVPLRPSVVDGVVAMTMTSLNGDACRRQHPAGLGRPHR